MIQSELSWSLHSSSYQEQLEAGKARGQKDVTVVFLTLNFGKAGTKCFTCLHSFNILLIILWLSLLPSYLLFVLNLSSSSYRGGNRNSEDFSNSPQFISLVSSCLCIQPMLSHYALWGFKMRKLNQWPSSLHQTSNLFSAPPPLHGLALPLRTNLPAFLLVVVSSLHHPQLRCSSSLGKCTASGSAASGPAALRVYLSLFRTTTQSIPWYLYIMLLEIDTLSDASEAPGKTKAKSLIFFPFII